MMRTFLPLGAAVSLLLVGVGLAHGATPSGVSLPAIFSDNMVLQRDASVPIWGQALPGDSISVKFGGQEKSTVADAVGAWKVHLDPMPASAEGSTLSIISGSGEKHFNEILVGEVWLCSGQSNMQATSTMLNITDDIQDADNPQIRLFTAPRAGVGKWVPSTTDAAKGFSATGFHFAQNLWNNLKVPVGVIVASEGSSSIETWIPPESILTNEFLIDQNGKPLIQEMEMFQEFFTKFDELSAEEKERVFLDHCHSTYVFARSFLNKDGTLKPDQEGGILWHMSVIKPAFSFNKFIAQILPYAVKGIVWYQGETNALGAGDPQYAQKQQILIEGWRKLWNNERLPFYVVQIPPCASYPWLADFWLQQYQAVRNTPHTALVPAVDLGDVKDSHPRYKKELGARIAQLALKDAYGHQGAVMDGPVYKSIQIRGTSVEVAFDHAGSGLATKDGQPPGWFEVAGPDKKFQKAEAVIVGDKIVISSPLDNPEYVSYAWSYLAEPNLSNKEGLPALPFNTAEAFFQKPPTAVASP